MRLYASVPVVLQRSTFIFISHLFLQQKQHHTALCIALFNVHHSKVQKSTKKHRTAKPSTEQNSTGGQSTALSNIAMRTKENCQQQESPRQKVEDQNYSEALICDRTLYLVVNWVYCLCYPGHRRVSCLCYPGHPRVSCLCYPGQPRVSCLCYPGQTRFFCICYPGQPKRGSTQRESLATQKFDSLECVPKPA